MIDRGGEVSEMAGFYSSRWAFADDLRAREEGLHCSMPETRKVTRNKLAGVGGTPRDRVGKPD